ncbi:MAG: alpha-amylase, partial [Spirochaetales bacterium]|nr:alpha-amylase [Spirochaetales bacterium]
MTDTMIDMLGGLYGRERAAPLYRRLEKLFAGFHRRPGGAGGRYALTEKDAVLIVYPDQLNDGEKPGFEVMERFLLSYVRDAVNTLHILPFFPYSSDDGFSIIDYREADRAYGGWEGIRRLGKRYRLMFDAVLNHVSAKSGWFEEFCAGNEEFASYFITCDPDADLSAVVRPRSSPLLTPFSTSRGEKRLWTTFSADQIDLNYRNPDVFLRMVEIMLFYISRGAAVIRLDAVAYIWKEPGTSCIHLPQVHLIVKLFRLILDRIAPHVVLITETNVPHRENISYLGNGNDEAQMVYQFPLPPLIAHALLWEDSRFLAGWAGGLDLPGTDAAFFNFTASHDGIGVRPLAGLVPEKDIDGLVALTKQRGGTVSYKTNSDGSRSPYELNINYMSLLEKPGEPEEAAVRRFLLSQSIMLAFPGVPGIYFHSLAGSINDSAALTETGIPRSINREKLSVDRLVRELNENRRRKTVFSCYKKMLSIRRNETAFSPRAPFEVMHTNGAVFAIRRTGENGHRVIAVHNMSSGITEIRLVSGLQGKHRLRDLLTRKIFETAGDGCLSLTLGPNEFLWLK